MSAADIKGGPVATKVLVAHIVRVALTNSSRTTTGMGHVFMPDKLTLRWDDDVLTVVELSGRRLRTDGHEWLTRQARDVISYLKAGYAEMASDTPDWVKELITEHKPATL